MSADEPGTGVFEETEDFRDVDPSDLNDWHPDPDDDLDDELDDELGDELDEEYDEDDWSTLDLTDDFDTLEAAGWLNPNRYPKGTVTLEEAFDEQLESQVSELIEYAGLNKGHHSWLVGAVHLRNTSPNAEELGSYEKELLARLGKVQIIADEVKAMGVVDEEPTEKDAIAKQLDRIGPTIPKDRTRSSRRHSGWLKERQRKGDNEVRPHRSSRSAIASLAIRSTEADVIDEGDIDRAEEVQLIRQMQQIESITPEEALRQHNERLSIPRKCEKLRKKIKNMAEGSTDSRMSNFASLIENSYYSSDSADVYEALADIYYCHMTRKDNRW